jgi:hypothetical protein
VVSNGGAVISSDELLWVMARDRENGRGIEKTWENKNNMTVLPELL